MADFHSLGEAIDSFTADDRVLDDDWSVRLAHDAFGVLKSVFPTVSHYRIRVLHDPSQLAFTCDGRHIFLTRTLLELCGSVDMAAFVIAHEIAHHELNHIPKTSGWAGGWPGAAMSELRHLVRPFERGRRELEADAFAIDMCVQAGLSRKECLRTFQILEKLQLDRRGIESTFGSDEFYCRDMSWFVRRVKIGLYLFFWRYYPIRIRRIMAERHAGMGRDTYRVYLS